MNPVIVNEVRRGFYLDSIALMQLSAHLAALPGVEDAVAMTGAPSNLEIMRAAGLLAPSGEAAEPNDLVLAVRAADEAAAEAAFAHARTALEREVAPAADGGWRPRTLDGALDRMADANLVLISTPGACAAREARRALDRGLNVMLFSDNVPLRSERTLKERAHALGLLVMGPDCGTAYIAGAPLAFANVVSRGRVGVIAASGTGLQEVSVLLTRAGGGISHGVGVGGRDLCDAVGGVSTLDAIDLLASDAGTDHLILVSKPPGPRTARRVFERLAGVGKPCTAVVFGGGGGKDGIATPPAEPALASTLKAAREGEVEAPPRGPASTPMPKAAVGGGIETLPAGLVLVPTLKAAVERALRCSIAPEYDAEAVARDAAARLGEGRRTLLGLFCGGTLATEAHAVLAAAGLDVASNVASPTPESVGGGALPAGLLDAASNATSSTPEDAGGDAFPAGRLDVASGPTSPAPEDAGGDIFPAGRLGIASNTASAARSGPDAPHTVVDLGADEYTAGRPHPMIDPAPRTTRLREALAEPGVAVVLLDVVLGLGAHPDPARPVCDAVREAIGEGPAVVASVCGTRDDPQDYERQAAMLGDAGVIVAPSNADAAAVAAAILGRGR